MHDSSPMDDRELRPSLDRAQSPKVAVPATAISGLNPEKLLQEVFGYPRFRGEQANIIQHICDGGDALVLMPTGGGKSLCYQIPALVREGAGIIVSPLIALMKDQVAALKQLGVRAAFLNSSQSFEASRATERALTQGELDLLYVAPERLMTPGCLQLLEASQLALFAIDEAHCVSQWGHDFRPEYLELFVLHQRFPGVPRVALTATADPQTRAEILDRLVLPKARVFISSFDRPNIRYAIQDKTEPREQLLRFIQEEHAGDSGIVYCISRAKVDETARWLEDEGIRALPYHAGMDSAHRARNQTRFQGEEGVVMVATIAFGMGIDKPDVRFVAHLDLPKSVEAYYQETGRAGRDGLPADVMMFYGLADVVQQRRFIDQSDASEDYKRVSTAKLDALLGLCETAACRRVRLLQYFGEASEPCGNCDNCLEPPRTWDGTEAAQKALSTIYRTGQRFGVVYLTEVLRGTADPRIEKWGHDKLSVYGVGREFDVNAWRVVFRQLVALGYVSVDHEAHGALKLTDSSRAVLRGEQRVELRQSALRARKGKATPKPKSGTSKLVNTDVQPLFDALKAWRTELARTQGVPPYVILHDRTLAEIARQRPSDLRALHDIDGIGAVKLECYGRAILELISTSSQ